MHELILEPTMQASWHRLVTEAEERGDCRLDEDSESYLVFLLMRYLQRPDLVRSILALRFLRAANASGRAGIEQMQDVGDQCLLYAGFYPEQAARRRVSVSYFINLGRTAYDTVASRRERATAKLFHELAETFVGLMDVLHTIRDINPPQLAPLEMHELAVTTGSRSARRQLADQHRCALMDAPARKQ